MNQEPKPVGGAWNPWRARWGVLGLVAMLAAAGPPGPNVVLAQDAPSKIQSPKPPVDEAELNRLIAALKDSSEYGRRMAAEALGQLTDPRVVDPLIAALKDSDGNVRRSAAEGLGRLGDRRAVDPLIEALKDLYIDSSAAEALGKLGDPRAVDPLIAALKDSGGNVRSSAVEALGKLGDRRAVDPLIAVLKDSNEHVRRSAASALDGLGEPLGTFIVRIHSPQSAAMKTLGASIDPRSVDPLIAALNDSDPNVRKAAAEALGQLGDLRAVDPLIAALKDENWNSVCFAAIALGHLGDPRAVDPLIEALKDSYGDVRNSAAEALGHLGDRIAVDPLIARLKDSDWYVRRSAAEALGKLGDSLAVDPLIATLKDSNEHVRRSAASALDGLGEPLGTFILRIHRGQSAEIKTLGVGIDPRSVDPLIAALNDSEEDVRDSAAEALVKIGAPAVDSLIEVLKIRDAEHRSAADALIEIGKPSVEPLLEELHEYRADSRWSFDYRGELAQALGRLGDVRAYNPLIKLLKVSETDIRYSAAAALGDLGDRRAVKPLIATLVDNWYRSPAVASLGKLGDPSAAGPLAVLLTVNDAETRRSAAKSLTQLGEPGLEQLFTALGTSQEEIRSDVFDALEDADASITRHTLGCLLGDPESIVQISKSGDLRVVRTFIAAAQDPDTVFRASAIAAFGILSRNGIFLESVVQSFGSSNRDARLGSGRLLAATSSLFSLKYAGHCAKGIFSPATLAYSAGVLFLSGLPLLWKRTRFRWTDRLDFWVAVLACGLAYEVLVSSRGMALFAVVPFVIWIWRKKTLLPRLPGWAGWIALGSLLVAIPLYGRYLLDGPGGAVLMGVSLTPLWLALLGGFVQGGIRWPRAWRRVKESVCQTHFSRFVRLAHTWPIRWSGGALWHPRGWDGDLAVTCGCRVCGERQPALAGIRRVVAVLDREGDWVERNSGDGELRVNWLKHRKPFDFDAVEVVNTTDDEVEAFTNQMRFESDGRIVSRLPRLGCRVAPTCGLKDGTMRLLGLVFGEVKGKGEGQG